MFSRYLTTRDIQSPYIPITSSRDLFVHLIQHSEDGNPDTNDSDVSLSDLLNRADSKDAASMYIFEASGYGFFLLWICRAGSTSASANSLNDAVLISQDFIEHSHHRQICVSFKREEVEQEKMPDRQDSVVLAVLARYDQMLASSLGLPLERQAKIACANESVNSTGLRQPSLLSLKSLALSSLCSSQLLCISGVIACIFVVLISAKILVTSQSPNKYHAWTAYDTHGSNGPRYQLSLTDQNVSSWTSSSIHNSREWALRVDDQALIPLSLMDDDEQHYQEWYQTHYPDVNQIRLNQDYLNETWLGSPAINQVLVDDLFHFSHCVLALRRYIKAKETGRHVCSRDIDHDHMRHCLDALDWWAFPSKRAEMVANPKRPFGWRTKVCFD